jgi:hypothetical protein
MLMQDVSVPPAPDPLADSDADEAGEGTDVPWWELGWDEDEVTDVPWWEMGWDGDEVTDV